MNLNGKESHTIWIRLPIVFIAIVFFFTFSAQADFTLGDPHAPVTIVEYGSLTCDYCVQFHKEVLPLIKSRHIEKGNVRFIYRDFPTSAVATRGAVAAQCAGPNQYYTMLNVLYATVGDWSQTKDVDAALVVHAISVGLNSDTFSACLNDPQQTLSVNSAKEQAVFKHDVTGTPTFLINGNIVRGTKNIDEMEVLIHEALERAK